MPSLALVYLCHFNKFALTQLHAFLSSHSISSCSTQHDVLVLFKDWNSSTLISYALKICRTYSAIPYFVPNGSYDLGSYFHICSQTNYNVYCFSNNNALILNDHWLDKLSSILSSPSTGLVGCSASLEAGIFSGIYTHRLLSPKYYFQLFSNLINLFHFKSSFSRFPSYHIRTNCFMIRRSLFLSYMDQNGVPSTKRDCHLIESGPNSLTNFVIASGLSALTVDRDGNSQNITSLPFSSCFRSSFQTNLLVLDNRIISYDLLSLHSKIRTFTRTWFNF